MTDRVALDQGWTMWPWIWVRGAGFPARRVLELAAPAAAGAADELGAAEQAVVAARAAAMADLRQLARDDEASARAARRAVDQLVRHRPVTGDLVTRESIRALRALEETAAVLAALCDRICADALAATAGSLRGLASESRFREAMLWQNRAAVRRGIDWLLSHPGLANSETRKNERLIASYVQRYCVKNDTIGFFGPIGWGEIQPGAGAITVQPGRELVRRRLVDLEHWAIAALAATISGQPDVKPFIAPRLLPGVAVVDTTLRYGLDHTATIPAAVARLLTACDGETTAIAIASAHVAAGDAQDADEVFELLAELVERRLVVWTLEPSAYDDAAAVLRGLLARIDAPVPRDRAAGMLARLEAARAEVTAAAGDAARLERTLGDLERTFEELTGRTATRRSGEIYAARTLVYEDCVRDLALTIGGPLLDRFAPVLTLVAHSARWFSHEIASRARARLCARHRELAATGPVGYLRFLYAIQDLLPQLDRGWTAGGVVVDTAEELDRRWSAILDLDMSRRRVEVSAASIAERVAQAFAAPGPGWPSARHIAPDVLVAARSVDAITRGDCTLVLGEVHIGNTFLARCVRPLGPDADDSLNRAYEQDIAARVFPVTPIEQVTRSQNLPWSQRDFDLELGTNRSWRPRDHVLRAADLVVEPAGESLAVRDLRRGRSFDVIAILETYLAEMAINQFKPVPRGPHVPRITVDGVVIAREQWRLAQTDLPQLHAEASPARRLVVIRGWAQALGLPRWVFVKIPEEPKPTYLDLESSIYVDMFARSLRRASSAVITEMLPSVDETWLPDGDGERYTCELRFVMVDPTSWTPPS